MIIYFIKLHQNYVSKSLNSSNSISPDSLTSNDDDNDVYLKKITTRVSQNLILHKNADQPKA
jgi:hypothetical protein